MRLLILIFTLSLISCAKDIKTYPVAKDPNISTFDTNGGTLVFGTLSTLEKLHIPSGALSGPTEVGYKYQLGARYPNVVDSIYPTANGYDSDGIFFYPLNTELLKTCTLDWSVSTQNSNINLSNIHFYKHAIGINQNTASNTINSITSSENEYIEILNYSSRIETANSTVYKVFELPVDSFQYYYLLCVEKN